MKTRAIPARPRFLSRRAVVALCAGCCAGFLALPDAAPALTGTGGGGESECVRFKAGREVKSGACEWVIGITNEYDVAFDGADLGKSGMSYACRPARSDLPDEEAHKLPNCVALVYPPPGDGRRYCAETDVMPGETCAFTLDGKPAAMPKHPPKPSPAWFCLEKTGTDEAMCLKRRNPFAGDEEAAPGPASAAPRFGFDGFLLGAFIDGKWVSDEDLQENEDFREHRVQGGETCRVYGFSAPESGVATLDPADDPEEAGVGVGTFMTARTASGASVDMGQARLLVTGDHDAMPRTAQILPNDNATYKKIVAEYLAGRGLSGAKPNIVQLLRVDLDGDGKDEVLIAAQNEVSEDERFSFAPDRPLLTPMMSPTGVPLRKAGHYSVVLLRRVVGGQAKNIALAEFISKKNAPADPDPYTDYAWVHKIAAIADLNGDGVMEIVTAEAFLRGLSYRVYETKGASPRKVLDNGFAGD